MLRYAWQDLHNSGDGIRTSEILTMDSHAHHSADTCISRMRANCQIIVPIGEHSGHYVHDDGLAGLTPSCAVAGSGGGSEKRDIEFTY